MKHFFTLLFCFCFSNLLTAQMEYHKWYFGGQAALDFVSGAPVTIANNAMTSIDNPASVSDSLGNLLFYSNGLEVWNKNHTVMANGTGLLGDNSGGHTATAVKQPGSSTIYYLFTIDNVAGNDGLRYSIIDMSLNGGLGGIVTGQKNVLLLTPVSEQIVPVVHANGSDIWVVTHPWNSSSFHSYLISCNGLNTTPVVSAVGSARSGNSNASQGQINVNAANNRIVTANWNANSMELFNFDNSSGLLSNPLLFSGLNRPWGVEFSPNGTKLYLSGWTTKYIMQYDLSTYTQAAIAASVVNLGDVSGPGAPYFTGYLQRGPDGKIYIAVYLDPFLAVINNPDAAGLGCNLVDDGLDLGGKTSGAGLPDKVVATHTSTSSISIGNDTTYCGNFSQTLYTGNANTLWSTGVTASQITVTASGTYWASIFSGCGSGVNDTITISQNPNPVVNLGNDTVLCTGQTTALSAVNPGATYQWQDNSTSGNFTVSAAGNYSVTVTAANGCATNDIIAVAYVATPPVINLGFDTTVCGDELTLIVHAGNAQYQWQDLTTDSFYRITSAGVYSVTVTNACGSATDEVFVNLQPDRCALLVPTGFSPNNDGANDIFRAISRCPVTKYSMHVYNRWGEQVFETDDVTDGWNGVFRDRPQPLSVYVYYIDYFNYCEQKMKKIVGNVTLVR